MKQLFKRHDQHYCGTRWQARDRAAYLRVPIDVAVGLTFLGEQLSPTAWTGLAFVLSGVVAKTLPNRDPAIAAASPSVKV